MPDGNNTIVAIAISTGDGLLFVVNCYMPSLDSGSTEHYVEHLDVLESIIDKYSVSHRVLLCGDFNGTQLSVRLNPHDRLIRALCEKKSLTDSLENSTKCTFFHLSGKSSSQIDYFLTKTDCAIGSSVVICDMQDINTLSHVSVTVCTNQYVYETVLNKHVKTNKCVKKLQWDKINKDTFQKTWINSLNSEQFESVTVEEKVELFSEMMRRAAAKSVPFITCKLKGPKRRVSPKVRELLKLCKNAHKNWKFRQDDSNIDILYAERKLAKKALRTQIRFEIQKKDDMISELMFNPSTKLFHMIVRRNRSDNSSTYTQYIKHNSKELCDPSEQVVAFTEFYEDLAMPKN